MIIDKISNSELYEFKNKGIKRAFEFIKSTDLNSLADCRSEIEEDNIYVIKSSYKTKSKEDAYFEAHRKYIDVQYIISGTETIGYAPNNSQKTHKEYDEENDYELYDAECSYITFREGMFAIFFPKELHKPGIISGDIPTEVKKIVVKVRV
ncbi:MAG: YhcH/YjgK/YiaL family protein [Candidatus Kapaibacterium sp.]